MAEISISIENKYFWREHKVITLKQQCLLGIILWVFCVFKKAVAIASLCVNEVEIWTILA